MESVLSFSASLQHATHQLLTSGPPPLDVHVFFAKQYICANVS